MGLISSMTVRAASSAAAVSGMRPSRTASVRGTRIGRAATEPSATRTSCQAAGPSGAVARPPRDRDEHLGDGQGPPGADLPEPDLAVRHERDAHGGKQLARFQRRLAVAGPELGRRDQAAPGRAHGLEHGVRHQQDREEVARRRCRHAVATDGAPVPDRDRPDDRGDLGQDRQRRVHEGRAAELLPGDEGAEHQLVVADLDVAQLVEAAEIQHRPQARPAVRERHHDVGAAGHGEELGARGQALQRVPQRGRAHELRRPLRRSGGTTSDAPSVPPSGGTTAASSSPATASIASMIFV